MSPYPFKVYEFDCMFNPREAEVVVDGVVMKEGDDYQRVGWKFLIKTDKPHLVVLRRVPGKDRS